MSGRPVRWKPGKFNLVPPKFTVDRTKLVKRGVNEMSKTELSHRTFKQQDAWFKGYAGKEFARPHQREAAKFYDLETKVIWKAFDTPELLGILLFDQHLKRDAAAYTPETLDAVAHWVAEARYWRCLGISLPFLDKDTLRANSWAEKGTLTGTIQLSQAMRDAVMDLERAFKRQELGLEPNYVWDQWTPMGNADGSRTDFLPRFAHNPYVDPDGVDVEEIDIAPYNTHELLKERYSEFIYPSSEPYQGVFTAIGHGPVGLNDVPDSRVRELYMSLKLGTTNAGDAVARRAAVDPHDLRTLFYLASNPSMMENLGDASSWDAVSETMGEVHEANDALVDAARLLRNTRDDPNRVRAFYEEKCGFPDFNWTPDKTITGAVMAWADAMKELRAQPEWGQDLMEATTDHQRRSVMGETAFAAYDAIERAALERRRSVWAERFSGEANEEKTLDYMLQNFSRRTERRQAPNEDGAEFDRETEPIGRNVQRRVLESDKARQWRDMMKRDKAQRAAAQDAFKSLHEKQYNVGRNPQ